MSSGTSTWRKLVRPVGFAVGISLIAVLSIHLIGVYLFDASMDVTIGDETRTITIGLAAGFTVGVVVLAGLVAAVLARFTNHAATVFLALATALFLAFSAGPLIGAEDTTTTVTLLAMHLAVLAPVLGLFLPALRAPASDGTATLA